MKVIVEKNNLSRRDTGRASQMITTLLDTCKWSPALIPSSAQHQKRTPSPGNGLGVWGIIEPTSGELYLILILFIIIIIIVHVWCVLECAHTMVDLWRSGDNFRDHLSPPL